MKKLNINVNDIINAYKFIREKQFVKISDFLSKYNKDVLIALTRLNWVYLGQLNANYCSPLANRGEDCVSTKYPPLDDRFLEKYEQWMKKIKDITTFNEFCKKYEDKEECEDILYELDRKFLVDLEYDDDNDNIKQIIPRWLYGDEDDVNEGSMIENQKVGLPMSNQSLDNLHQNCSEVRIKDTDLSFIVCVESTGVRIKHKEKEVLIDFNDFKNPRALREVLDEEFGYDVRDPLSGKIAFSLQDDVNVNQLLNNAKRDSYEVCLEFINGECNGVFITANENGAFITEKVYNKTTGDFDNLSKKISSLKVKKIQNVKFNGIFDVDFGAKFVKIETYDGEILTGEIDELTTLIKAKYGLEQQEKFKFLLNQDYETIPGYYAVGAWFNGDSISFATESLYNPSWKKIDKYKLPPDIPAEKKKEVLERIIGLVNAFKDKGIVTWILSFGVIANFAHFLRQKVGYFPHAIIVGKQKTGKTTLTVLNQYLYWGSNPLPPIKPKTEPQLRQLLSQSTLLTPIEEWNELASSSEQVSEMLSSLHGSAQRFVLKRITTSNPDVNGTFLSLSSILADTNFTQEIDPASLDKILFIKLDKEEGIDINKAQEKNALLKNELKGNYRLHDILHSIGIELIQVTAEKLKRFDFNKERAELLDDLIFTGYSSWIDLFKKYGITLTMTVDNIYSEFPLPELKLVEAISDEDLNLMFEEFINSKVKQIVKEGGGVPANVTDFMRYGFYFKDDEIICNFGLVSEFNKWLSNTKGLKQRPISRLISDLGFKKTTVRVNGQVMNAFKLSSVLPSISEIE